MTYTLPYIQSSEVFDGKTRGTHHGETTGPPVCKYDETILPVLMIPFFSTHYYTHPIL